jgi:MFS family permease
VILFVRTWLGEEAFAAWGWRVPFLVSIVLLGISVWIRLQLQESPAFVRMKQEGTQSKAPLSEAFGQWNNAKIVLLALLGLVAGQAVVWYTGQFYALFFLTQTLKMDGTTANLVIAFSLLIGTPFFIFFGWLSDRIGRLKIILAGCLIAALTYFPLFAALTHYVNPALEKFQQANAITVAAKDCNFHVFVGPWSKFSDCDKAKDFLTKAGLSFKSTDLPAGATDNVVINIGGTELKGFDPAKAQAVLKEKGYPAAADKNAINWPMTLLILFVMLIYVTMVYGPIAAFLVEMFPTKIRYTSMSLPYHIGNGWFGGMLPLLATAMVAASGDIYYGLWYPIVVALMTFVVGLIFLKDRKDIDLQSDESVYT